MAEPKIRQKFNDIDNKMGILNEQIDSNNIDISNIQTEIADARKGETTLKAKMDKVETSVADMMNTASLGSSGWFKDKKTGLILQWGWLYGVGIQNGTIIDATPVFPITFPNNCFIFMGQLATVDNNNFVASNYNSISRATGISAGWFYAKNIVNAPYGALADIFWFAIGN